MITIGLPFPDSALFPNRSNGRHWAVRGKAAKEAREFARLASLNSIRSHRLALNLKAKNVPLRLTFYPPDRRWRDTDNLHTACKPYQDGIADAIKQVADASFNDRKFRPVTIDIVDDEPHEVGAVVFDIG